MNFIKITFHDIDFWSDFQDALLKNDSRIFIQEDLEQCRKLVAAFVYAEHIKRSVLLGREFQCGTYEYLLTGINVKYNQTLPEQTHEDVQWAIDVNREYAWQL